jgi:hypothetical protein
MSYTPSFRDVEKLSAYLDGQLKPSEIARLESRLKTDPELASILKDLRQTRGLLRRLPQRRAPRNFTLTPKMVGQKPPLPRTYPAFRFATVLATLLLFFTFATNFLAPLASTAAPYPYGRGGGGGEPEVMMESAPEEPAQEMPAAEEPAAPLATPPAPGEEDGARVEPTTEAAEQSGDTFAFKTTEDERDRAPAPLIGESVQIVLAGIAILSALVAFALRYIAIRKWRAKAK